VETEAPAPGRPRSELRRATACVLPCPVSGQTVAANPSRPGDQRRRTSQESPWDEVLTARLGRHLAQAQPGRAAGSALVQSNVKIIEGRQYRQGLHEVTVSEPIRKMYRNMNIGDHLVLLKTQWTIVGVFAGNDSIGDSVLRADADTVMSAFNRNTYQAAQVQLESPQAFSRFKDALTATRPALSKCVPWRRA
jgi:hypothetical protein